MRDANHVNVVGHKTVTTDFKTVALGVFLEQGEIELPVRVREEHPCSVVPALDDVMGKTFDDNPCYAWHACSRHLLQIPDS
jgi:hypothetical protein